MGATASLQLAQIPIPQEYQFNDYIITTLKFPPGIRRIRQNELRLEDKLLGRGGFGVVRKGAWRNLLVAVKEVSEEQCFITEINELSRTIHPNVVKLFGFCYNRETQRYSVVMEFAPNGSLYDMLHNNNNKAQLSIPNYSAGNLINWSIHCARGMEYLHSLKPPIIHRDLKPANLLLFANGLYLKVSDFGSACPLRTYMTNNVGSVAWMAPEVFRTSEYDEKCDVYSFGITLWEITTRRRPYEKLGTQYAIMWAVSNDERPPNVLNCPTVLHRLITQCWDGKSWKRPSFSSILKILHRLQPLFQNDRISLPYDR